MNDIRPGSIERLLIRSTNWVGDAVMSVPAMREIRRLFPRAHITLLARPWVRDVYSAVEFVDTILDYDKDGSHRGWPGMVKLVSSLRKNRYDAAILLQNAFEAAAIAWASSIPVRIGYARDGRAFLLTHACSIDPAVRKVHQLYYYLGLLADLGLVEKRLWENKDYRPSISIGVRDSDRIAAKEILRSSGILPGVLLIGLNPGAYYGGAKRWFSDRYAAVADALAEKYGATLLIFGSAAERRIADEIALKMKSPAMVLAGRTTLGQLMGLIKECRLFITNDSGPMHLAAALDVPQLAIFGSTSEIATGPLGANAEVIKEKVECSPCFLRECPIDFRCMQRITVERVVAAAERRLMGCGE